MKKNILKKLVNNSNSMVRSITARQGYGLDILINDDNSEVREAVAEQGHGLIKLIDDECAYVRVAAVESLFDNINKE